MTFLVYWCIDQINALLGQVNALAASIGIIINTMTPIFESGNPNTNVRNGTRGQKYYDTGNNYTEYTNIDGGTTWI